MRDCENSDLDAYLFLDLAGLVCCFDAGNRAELLFLVALSFRLLRGFDWGASLCFILADSRDGSSDWMVPEHVLLHHFHELLLELVVSFAVLSDVFVLE